MFKATVTLSSVLSHCDDWDKFCEEKGYSIWCVNEGGGDIEIELTKDELIKYGLL